MIHLYNLYKGKFSLILSGNIKGTLETRLHSFLADRLTPFKPGWQMMPTIKAVSTLFWDIVTALSLWIKAIGVTFKQI